jgi:hypothetical protein
MFVSVRFVYLNRGRLCRGTIHTRLRYLENALPWLKAHYPNIRFRWDLSIAFYR